MPVLVLNYDDVVNDVMDELKINILEFRLRKYIDVCKNQECEISTVKLKIYENQLNDKIISDIERLTAENNIKLIKE